METPEATSLSPHCHNYTSTDSLWNRPAENQANCVPSAPTGKNRRQSGSPMNFLHVIGRSLHESAPSAGGCRRRSPAGATPLSAPLPSWCHPLIGAAPLLVPLPYWCRSPPGASPIGAVPLPAPPPCRCRSALHHFPVPLRVLSMNAATLACKAFKSGSWAYTMWPEV
jgi:hypothetical protein